MPPTSLRPNTKTSQKFTSTSQSYTTQQYKNHPYPKPNGTDVLKQQNQSIDIGKKTKSSSVNTHQTQPHQNNATHQYKTTTSPH
ncbi:MAG: hypothetical protein O7C59_09030 [Rickettsia endosymbiont of Ixodes persulcatus]|nr:hypothetical protein [Rickettsia endosymbiont of Ixodes persulcatus]